MPNHQTILLSIHPQHAHRIFSGDKTIELRRVRPRVSPGDKVIVYITAPESLLAGAFDVSEVYQCSPTVLWAEIGPKSGLSRAAFRAYFAGAHKACGIGIGETRRFTRPVPLAELRKHVPGFHPPQSYSRVPEPILRLLNGNGRTASSKTR
jgi:predicted transcriptional regulator